MVHEKGDCFCAFTEASRHKLIGGVGKTPRIFNFYKS
jgi:hypothetical protein